MTHVIWHGHSFVEILTDEGSILIDPFITGNTRCDVSFEDVINKNIMAICITHGHGDHIGDTMALVTGKHIPIICEYGVGNYFQEDENYEYCHAAAIGGTIKINDDLQVKFFAATHGGGILKTHRSCCPAGLLITYKGKKIYHAGDTSLMFDMQMLAKYAIDVACIPIDGLYNMDIEDAATAVSYIKPKIVFPIHFDTWPKIRVDAVDFARRVMADTTTVPKVLTPGQYIVLE